MSWFARQELDMAGFPPATRELAFAVPVEDLAGDSAELELELRVTGVEGHARMSVGYLPGGPVTAGQQLINNGESRVLRKQLVKPGSVLVVVLDQPGHVDVRVRGARGYDEDGQLEVIAGDEDMDEEAPLGLDEDARRDSVAGDDGMLEDAPLGADDKVVSAIGAAAAATADRIAVMGAVLQRLEQLYAAAKKERSTSFLLLTGSSVDAQLDTCRKSLDYLKGEGFARVASGEAQLTSGNPDAPAWLEVANGLGDLLRRIAGDVEKWDLSSTVAAAAPDVAKVAEDVGKGSLNLVNGLITLGVVYLLVRFL